MSEKSIQTYILKKLREIPDSWWIKPTTTNLKGCPDIIGCLEGLFISIEVKDIKGKPSTAQEYQGKLIKTAGGIHILASSWKNVDVIISKMRIS